MSESSPQSTFQNLIVQRYGDAVSAALRDFENDNAVLETLLSHKSVRDFKDQPLPAGTLEALVSAGQSASSSSNLQAWSVVALQNPIHKSAAATLCGDQDFIRQAPLFLVFIADLARLKFVSQQQDLEGKALDYVEMFLVAVLDAGFAAQNIAVAAESLGLGLCYAGAARNHPRELADLLKLPQQSIALFGMAIGWPKDDLTTTVKPRLPQTGVLHYETYGEENWADAVESYDATMDNFYHDQDMQSHQSWSQSTAKRVASKASLGTRHELRQILLERGFNLE